MSEPKANPSQAPTQPQAASTEFRASYDALMAHVVHHMVTHRNIMESVAAEMLTTNPDMTAEQIARAAIRISAGKTVEGMKPKTNEDREVELNLAGRLKGGSFMVLVGI